MNMDAGFSYRQAAVQGASPVQLVIYLYDQAVDDLRRAISALQKRDAEGRTRAINHALKVIGQLQGTVDVERGGAVAGNLHRFYNAVRRGLSQAQVQQSARMLREQIDQLSTVREAWMEVQRIESCSSPSAAPLSRHPDIRLADWNA